MNHLQWPKLCSIRKFTSIDDVFKEFGEPKFKIRNTCSYYMGNGFIISYSTQKFNVVGTKREEYGEPGIFALRIAYFQNTHELESYYMLEKGEYIFDFDEKFPFNIVDEIYLGDSFDKVSTVLRPKASNCYYKEGETRALKGETFIFQKNYIDWDNYQFYFFEKSKKTKMSAFSMTFFE